VLSCTRRQFLARGLALGALGVSVATGCSSVPLTRLQATRPTRTPRIGYLGYSFDPQAQYFQQGLFDLGYVENRSITVDYVYSERPDDLGQHVARLVDLGVDAILTTDTPATIAAQRATSVIPIVMLNAVDPVRNGLVASLARPGGNITGLSQNTAELSGKRLELLREVRPTLSRVAVFWNPDDPSTAGQWDETRLAADRLGMRLDSMEIRRREDFEPAFRTVANGPADAVMPVADPIITRQHRQVVYFAAEHRRPAIYYLKVSTLIGGLMSYGPNERDQFRRATVYVDKILKGARPGDLPVEQPTTFEFVVNKKTADTLRLTIPPSVLAQATEIIQ